MKLFDCFLFYNELELLELRLEEVYPYVDHVVLVEANVTHNGTPKEFVFDKNKSRFKKYLDKIIHVKLEDCPPHSVDDPLVIERFARKSMRRGLEPNAKPGDRVMVSDLDEIPNMEVIMPYVKKEGWYHFKCDLFYYYVNCRVARSFGGVVMATWDTFGDPQRLRKYAIRRGSWHQPTDNLILNAGWHYSYLTGSDPEAALAKVRDAAESHVLSSLMGDRDTVIEKIKKHQDPFGRNQSTKVQEIVDISHNKPKSLDKWLEKYPQYFYHG